MKTSEANIEDLKGMVVSDGTMRPEDLIPKFLNVLKVYGRDVYDKYVGENPEVLDLSSMDDETMGWVVDELFDKLNEIAPEGYSFGSQDGDGACYGFWSVDADESKKCEDVPEIKVGDFVEYDKNGKEDWNWAEVTGVNEDGTLNLHITDMDKTNYADVDNVPVASCRKLPRFAGMTDTGHYYMDGPINLYKGGWEICVTKKNLDPSKYEFIGTIDSYEDMPQVDAYYDDNYVYDEDDESEVREYFGIDFPEGAVTFADFKGDVVGESCVKGMVSEGYADSYAFRHARHFADATAPVSISVKQATQGDFPNSPNDIDHLVIGFMNHDKTRFIVDWDGDKQAGKITRQVMVDDKDSTYGYKWVTPLTNATATFTNLGEFKTFVQEYWDNTSSESKKCEAYIQPVTLYSTTRYDDAEAVQSFLRDIGGDAVTVDKQRNGDVLSVNVSGSDDDVEAFVDTYKNEYGSIVKDCEVDATGWTAPEDIYYIATEQGRKELRGESKKFEADGSLGELIDKVDNMFHYHNKNLNNYQYNTIDDLLEALKSKDTNKIKAAISNLDNLVHYRNKNLNKSQYYMLDELLEALQKKYKKSEESKKSETKEDKPVWGVTVEYTPVNGETRRTDVAPSCSTEERAKEAAIARVTKDYGPLKDVKIIRVDRLPGWAARNIRDLVRNNKTESMSNCIENATITEQEFSDILNAYVKEIEGTDIKPIRIEVLKTEPVAGDGTLIKFHYDARENGWSNARTYALVFGDLHKNRDNDLLYVLHDWQSGEKVTPEDTADHDWELVNNHIRPSEILDSTKSSESLDPSIDVKGRGVVELSEDDYLKLSRDINSRGYCKDKDGAYNVWIGGSFKGTFPSVEAAADAGYTLVEGKRCEAQVSEKTFKQGVDEFIGAAPEGGWSDYWAMQQDWEFYKDSLCRDGVITQKQADSWSNPCTPDTFDRWQKRNGLVRRGYESKQSEGIASDIRAEKPTVYLVSEAGNDYDYDELLDAFEGEQSYVSVETADKSVELPLAFDRDKNLLLILDDELSGDDAAYAKELVQGFVDGKTSVSSKPLTNDYVCIVDGMDYTATCYVPESKKSEARPTKQEEQIKELCKLCRNDKNVAESVFKALTKDYNTSLDPELAGQYLTDTWKSKLEELGGCNGWYDGFKKLYAAMGSDFVCSVLQDLKLGSSGIGCGACITIVDTIYDKVVKRNESKKSESLPESRQHENHTKEEEVTNIFTGMKDWASKYPNDPDRKIIADNLDLDAVQDNMSDIVEILDNNFEWDGYGFRFVVVGDYEDDDTRDEASTNQWNRCYGVCEEIADLIGIPDEGHAIGEMNIYFWEEIEADWRDDDSKSAKSKKSESLTLKQKELKDMARFGQAEDITTISDAEAKELKKKGIETVGISRGVYGMNGALLRDSEGKKYVITARSSNLFYFV